MTAFEPARSHESAHPEASPLESIDFSAAIRNHCCELHGAQEASDSPEGRSDPLAPKSPLTSSPHPLLGPGRPEIPTELHAVQERIENAAKGHGLTFYPISYEMLTSSELNAVAARDGFPVRYPHWRFGMEYEFLHKSYEFGSSKIYELVINNNPTYAYLMDTNELHDQEFVMAHVTGHADFFKNNVYFAHTNRQAIDMMAAHASRVRGYMDALGRDVVERFIDAALSMEDLIDPYSVFRKETTPVANTDDFSERQPGRIPVSREYLDSFINPPELLKKIADDERRAVASKQVSFPEEPVRDIIGFVAKHAPLNPWQRDILEMVREEAYYFLPQRQTKIMNEGWASYWHTTLMREQVLDDSRLIPFAQLHSGVTATAPGQLNPYKLGLELFRDIEDRWNKGKFGPEWEGCTDAHEKEHWDRNLGLGREKIMEVRKVNNDLSFIANYLTQEFCEEHKLFTFSQNKTTGDYVIRSKEFEKVREQLIKQLVNSGRPSIHVQNANYENRGELLLKHNFESEQLREDYAQGVMKNLFSVWGRPVHLESRAKASNVRYTYDEKGFGRKYT